MKRALIGLPAYDSIIGAELPEKTKTYTPIAHEDIMVQVRKEITEAGFKVKQEHYKSSNEGKIALGTFILEYKSDPDIVLTANFVNSYNKQYAFRFNLGGYNKLNGTSMMLNSINLGAYKRVHKGEADSLAKGKITELISDAGEYWKTLLEHKDMMKQINVSEEVRDMLLGKLFFTDDVLNGLQMKIIHKNLCKPEWEYSEDLSSCWVLYNHIAVALKESRPSTWITDQIELHQAFDDIIDFDSKEKGESIIKAYKKRYFTSGAVEVREEAVIPNPAQIDLEDSIAEMEEEGHKYTPPCVGHAVMSEEEENEANKRMDVIGRNGNDGFHYDHVDEEDFDEVKSKPEFEFFGPGDGVEFEIWSKDDLLYKVPIKKIGNDVTGEVIVERVYDEAERFG